MSVDPSSSYEFRPRNEKLSYSLDSLADDRRPKQLFTMAPYLLEPPPSPENDLHHVFKFDIVHERVSDDEEEEELQTCLGESMIEVHDELIKVENPSPLPSPGKESLGPVGVISLPSNRKLSLPPRSEILSSTPKIILPVLVLEDLFKDNSPVGKRRRPSFHGSTVFHIKEDASTTDILIFNTPSFNPEHSDASYVGQTTTASSTHKNDHSNNDKQSSSTRSTAEKCSEESSRQRNAQRRASPLINSPCADINTKESQVSPATPRNSKPAEEEEEMPKGKRKRGRKRKAVHSSRAPTTKPCSDNDERPDKRLKLQQDSFQSAPVDENGSSNPIKKAKENSSSRETPNSDCENGKESCKDSSHVNQGKSSQERIDPAEPSNGEVSENSPMRQTITANELYLSPSDDDEEYLPAPSTKRRKFSKTKNCSRKSSNSSGSSSELDVKKSSLIKLKNTVSWNKSSSSSSDSSGKPKSPSLTTTTKSPSVFKAGTPSAQKTSALLIQSKSLVSSASKKKKNRTSSSSSTDSSDDEATNKSCSAANKSTAQKPLVSPMTSNLPSGSNKSISSSSTSSVDSSDSDDEEQKMSFHKSKNNAKQVKKTSALFLNSKNSENITSAISLSGSSDDKKRKSTNHNISAGGPSTSNTSVLSNNLVPSEPAKEDINSSTSSKSKTTKETLSASVVLKKSKKLVPSEPPLKNDSSSTSSSSESSDERSESFTKNVNKAASSGVPKKTPKETPLSKRSSNLPKKSKKVSVSKKMDVSSTSSGSSDSSDSDDKQTMKKSTKSKISKETLSASVVSKKSKKLVPSEPPLKEDNSSTSSLSDSSDEKNKKPANSKETPKETPLSKSSSNLPKKSKKVSGSKKMDVSSTSSDSSDSEKRRRLLSVIKMKHASSKVSKETLKQTPSTKKAPLVLPKKSLAPSKKVDTSSEDEKRRRLLIMTQKLKSASSNAITKEKKTKKGLLGGNTNIGRTKVSSSKSSSSRDSFVEVGLFTSDSDDSTDAKLKPNEPTPTIVSSSESSLTDSEDAVEEVPVRKRGRKDVVPPKNTMKSLQNDILRSQASFLVNSTSGRFVENPVSLGLGKASRKFYKKSDPPLFLRHPTVDDPIEEDDGVTRRREEQSESHSNSLPLDSMTSSAAVGDTSSSNRDNLSTWELLIQGKSLPGRDFWEDILKDEDCKVNEAHFSPSVDKKRGAHRVYRDPKFSPNMKVSKRVIQWILDEHGSMDVSPLNAFCPLHSRMTPDALQLVRSRFPLLRRGRLSPEEMGVVRQNLKKLMVELDLTPESARGLMKEIIYGDSIKMKSRYYLGCFAGQGILDRRFIHDVYKWISSFTISTAEVVSQEQIQRVEQTLSKLPPPASSNHSALRQAIQECQLTDSVRHKALYLRLNSQKEERIQSNYRWTIQDMLALLEYLFIRYGIKSASQAQGMKLNYTALGKQLSYRPFTLRANLLYLLDLLSNHDRGTEWVESDLLRALEHVMSNPETYSCMADVKWKEIRKKHFPFVPLAELQYIFKRTDTVLPFRQRCLQAHRHLSVVGKVKERFDKKEIIDFYEALKLKYK